MKNYWPDPEGNEIYMFKHLFEDKLTSKPENIGLSTPPIKATCYEYCSSVTDNISLCRSFESLLHVLSSSVVRTKIFKFCAMFPNDWLLKSLPLLVRIDPEILKYTIQCLKVALMMSELPLLGIPTGHCILYHG